MSLNKNYSEMAWQNMERSKKMKKILDDKILTDCEFCVGPDDSAENFKGHKIMFIIESPVFEKMMTGEFIEATKNQVIRIPDILPNDFKNFRKLIYYNEYKRYSKFTIEEIFELYHIADKYLVSSISNNCLQYLLSIKKNLKDRNIISLFEFASQVEDKSFQSKVEKEISQRDIDTILNEKINEFSFKLFYEYILFVSKLPNAPIPQAANADYYRQNTVQNTAPFPVSRPLKIFLAIESYFTYNHLFEYKIIEITQYVKTSNSLESPKVDELEADPKNAVKKLDVDVSKDHDLENSQDHSKTQHNTACKILEIQSEKDELKFQNINTFKRKILRLVKFSEMTIKEFINGPGNSELLKASEKFKFLAKLCNSDG